MKSVILVYGLSTVIAMIFTGCGGGEITEPVPMETLVIYIAEVTKPSALYKTSEVIEEDQFYFLEQGETVEVLRVSYPGGPTLIRTADGEEGWCPDIAMKTDLMAGTFAAEALSARYPDGVFRGTAPGVVGWVVGDNAYFVTAAASGDFTGDGEAETAICKAVSRGEDITLKAIVVNPETYEEIAETAEYPVGEKGVTVEWAAINATGHAAVSLAVWDEESVESPLRLKEIETTHIWLCDGEMGEALRFVSTENVVTAGAATPDNISKGSFLGRFYWQRRVTTEIDYNDGWYYALKAIESINLYCCDEQVFEYEAEEPIVYEYGSGEGYIPMMGEFFEAPLSGNQIIDEPARLRRQPAEAGDPIRIIEAGETVKVILGWPDFLETAESEGYWYYVYYQTKESENEYAGWVLDKYFE